MKLAWHIAGKDVVRLRWILVLWGIVLIAGLGLTTIQAGLDYENYFPFYIAANVLVSGISPLMAFGLVMGLLHDDPVAEIDAFWITRPISGGELLQGKALALLLVGVIPVVVTVPFWLSHDYRWDQILLAVRQTLRSQLIIAVLALPFAVISANGSKFVMNLLIGGGSLLLLVLLFHLGNATTDPSSVDSLVIQSKAWLMVCLWLVTTLIVTLNQFLRRRTRQSLTLLAIAVGAGFAVAKWSSVKLDFAGNRPTDSSPAFEARLGRELPIFPGRIDAESKRAFILAEVPLREAESASRHGTTLKIQTVLLDFTGALQVSFSEATPHLSEKFRDLLPGASPRPGAPVSYFILNRGDGRAFAVKPTRHGSELNAATLNFSHSSVSTRPANLWQGSAPPNLAAWLKNATLIKVVADDSGPAPSATTAVQFSR